MRSVVQKHPAAMYFALTFAISWGTAWVAVGSTGGMRGTTPASDSRFASALIAMLAGPSLSGLLLTALVSRGAGLREYLSRVRVWRADVTSYAVAVLLAPLAMTSTLLALSIASPAFTPGIVTSSQKAFLVSVSLAVGLSAGILEELGWTGFATPALRRRYGVWGTGLILGVLWSGWHLFPLIWARQAAAGGLTMPAYLAWTIAGVFVGYLTAFRVLMVWLFDRTGSICLGMLMHVSITTSLLVLNPLGLAGADLQIYSFALAALTWFAAAVVLVSSHRSRQASPRPGRGSGQSTSART